jgi:protein-tyrosine phosphatase
MTDDRFGILVVCHANLCRSPMAERLARQAFADRLGAGSDVVEVTSAGTHAWSNQRMHPYAERVLGERLADAADFQSRRLSERSVRAAGLVLTATRRQRSACVAFDPAAVRRTFTILQFGRYLAALSASEMTGAPSPRERLREVVDRIAVVRSEVRVVPAADDDLADPVEHPVEAFRRCAAELWPIVDLLAEVIAGHPPAARHRLSADRGRS